MGLTPVHVLGKEGVEQERVHQLMRNWCVMSSHRAVSLHPELQVLVQRLCLLVNWGSSPSQGLLAPCTPCSRFSLNGSLSGAPSWFPLAGTDFPPVWLHGPKFMTANQVITSGLPSLVCTNTLSK